MRGVTNLPSEPINPAWRQVDSRLRLDWGLQGALAIASSAEIAVVVDVLSFSTAVTVALDRGANVFPCRWDRETASEFAASRRAMLAVRRSSARPGEISLSPQSIRDAAPFDRLVLPSPNGSTISEGLAEPGTLVVAGCVRNRRAVTTWLQTLRLDHPGLSVAIVAAGEQWPNGALRPALEDFLGAGLIASELIAGGWPNPSPETVIASSCSQKMRGRVTELFAGSASGRELVNAGWECDVAIAAELDASGAVPILIEGCFVDARSAAARLEVAQRLHSREQLRPRAKDDQ